jgi:hypothetical protein
VRPGKAEATNGGKRVNTMSSHNHPDGGHTHGPEEKAGSPGPTSPRPRAGLPRLAFYGRTNVGGITGVHILAGQLDACLHAAEDRASITAFFYDLPAPLDELTVLAVRGAGGPPCRDGGWDDLAAAIPTPDRGFEAIVCATPGRLSVSLHEVEQRIALAARHGVPVATAEDLPALFPPPTLPTQRGTRQPTAPASDDDYASAASAPGEGGGPAEAVLRAAVSIRMRPQAATAATPPAAP